MQAALKSERTKDSKLDFFLEVLNKEAAWGVDQIVLQTFRTHARELPPSLSACAYVVLGLL
jgi:hypothetical protein